MREGREGARWDWGGALDLGDNHKEGGIGKRGCNVGCWWCLCLGCLDVCGRAVNRRASVLGELRGLIPGVAWLRRWPLHMSAVTVEEPCWPPVRVPRCGSGHDAELESWLESVGGAARCGGGGKVGD